MVRQRRFTSQPLWLAGIAMTLLGFASFAAAMVFAPLIVLVCINTVTHCVHFMCNVALLRWTPPHAVRDAVVRMRTLERVLHSVTADTWVFMQACALLGFGVVCTSMFGYREFTCLTSPVLRDRFNSPTGLAIVLSLLVISAVSYVLIRYAERFLSAAVRTGHVFTKDAAVAHAIHLMELGDNTPANPSELDATASAPHVPHISAEYVHTRSHITRTQSLSGLPSPSSFSVFHLHLSGPWFCSVLPFAQPIYLHAYDAHTPWEAASTHRSLALLPSKRALARIHANNNDNTTKADAAKRVTFVLAQEESKHLRRASSNMRAIAQAAAAKEDTSSAPPTIARARAMTSPLGLRATQTVDQEPDSFPRHTHSFSSTSMHFQELERAQHRRAATEKLADAVRRASRVVKRSALEKAMVHAAIDMPPAHYLPMARLHPLAYACLLATTSSLCILLWKCVVEQLKAIHFKHETFQDGYLYVFAAGCFLALMCRQHMIASAMQLFDAVYIMPIYHAFYISGVAAIGGIFFKEFSMLQTAEATWSISACILCMLGCSVLADQSSVALHRQMAAKEHRAHEKLSDPKDNGFPGASSVDARSISFR
jgi:hypothetical protein